MPTQPMPLRAARGFILVSALSLLSVSLMAFANPQAVMDLVGVRLTSPDAFSSIRGVYGGVSLTLFISLLYLMVREPVKGLALLALLWGFYALSRTVTIVIEGALGTFGQQWLVIEATLFGIALGLLWWNRQSTTAQLLTRHEAC